MSHSIYTLDIGNSHPHIAEFTLEGDLLRVVPFSNFIHENKTNNLELFCSQVGALSQEVPQGFKLLKLGEYDGSGVFHGMKVDYTKGIGSDRLLEAFWYFENNAKKSTLLIDCGTFTTIDFISPTKGLIPGPIILGAKSYLESVARKGHLLPSVGLPQQQRNLSPISKNTTDAILNGLGIMFKGAVNQSVSCWNPDQIVITGGNTRWAQSLINEETTSFDHLIHHALFKVALLEKREKSSIKS